MRRRHRVRQLVLEHPFELFVGVLCFASGLPVLVGAVRPGTIIAALPPALQLGWGVSLTGGAALVLAGLLSRTFNPFWFRGGLGLERSGMLLLTTSMAVYAVVLPYYSSLQQSGVTFALLVALSLACTARAFAIKQVLRKLEDPRVKGAGSADD
jgi:hypothetical protein